MGKYSDCQLQTPLVRPKSTIQDTPKRDDKHLRHFYMGVPRVIMNVPVCWQLHSVIHEAIKTLVNV